MSCALISAVIVTVSFRMQLEEPIELHGQQAAKDSGAKNQQETGMYPNPYFSGGGGYLSRSVE